MNILYLYLSGLSLRRIAERLRSKGIERSHEAIRRWVKRLGLKENRVEKPKANVKASTTILLENPVKGVERIFRIIWQLYGIALKSKYRIMYYVKPLKPKQVFRLLDPRSMVGIELPDEWIGFVKDRISFKQALEKALNIDFYVDEIARISFERKYRPRKARWGFKHRSFFRNLVDPPGMHDLWSLAERAARIAFKLTGWRYRGLRHDPVKLAAALMLKFVPRPKGYRLLAKSLRDSCLSTGVEGEAYPSKSTLHYFAKRMPKHVYTAILLALYAIIFGEYIRVYGLNVLRYAYYVVDSTNVSVERYVKAFRRLREVLEKARVKFIVLYWPIADIALTFFGRPRELVDWLKILPRNSLLICDREFWSRRLIYACNRFSIGLSIIPRGRTPLGFTPKLHFYWIRRLGEKVFAFISRRDKIFYARTVYGMYIAVALAVIGVSLVNGWRRLKLMEYFTPIG